MLSNNNIAQREDAAAPFTKKVYIVSMDMDACLGDENFTQALQEFKQLKDQDIQAFREKYKYALHRAHLHLIGDIINKARDYDEIIVMVGSNRQTLSLDNKNAVRHKNGSCFDAVKYLAEILAEQTNKPVHADLRIYEDALTDKSPGFHAKAFLNNEVRQFIEDGSTSHVGDNKYCMIFLQIMQLCLSQPDCEFGFGFYDDLKSIVEQATKQFAVGNLGDMMPANLRTVEFTQYKSSMIAAIDDTLAEIKALKGDILTSQLLDFLLLIANNSVKLATQLQAILKDKKYQDDVVNVKLKMATTEKDKKLAEELYKQGKEEVYADLVKEENFRLNNYESILGQIFVIADIIRDKFEPTRPNLVNGNYMTKLRAAMAGNDYLALLKLFTDPSMVTEVKFPAEFTPEKNKLTSAVNKILQGDRALSQLKREIELADNAYPDLQNLFSLEENMLRKEVIENVNKFIAEAKKLSVSDTFPLAKLNNYIQEIVKLAELFNLKNYPTPFRPKHVHLTSASEKGFGSFIQTVHAVHEEASAQLALHGSARLCSYGLRPVQIPTRPCNVKLVEYSQNDIVRACLDVTLWPVGATPPSLAQLHKAYKKAATLLELGGNELEKDFVCFSESRTNNESFALYKETATKIAAGLNADRKRMKESKLCKVGFYKKELAVCKFEIETLAAIKAADSLEGIVVISNLYLQSVKLVTKLGANANKGKESATMQLVQVVVCLHSAKNEQVAQQVH